MDPLTCGAVQHAWLRAFVGQSASDRDRDQEHSGFSFPASARAHYDQRATWRRFGTPSRLFSSGTELYWYRVLEQARCDAVAIARFRGIAINIRSAMQRQSQSSASWLLYRVCTGCFWGRAAGSTAWEREVGPLDVLPACTPAVLARASRFLTLPADFEECVAELVVELSRDDSLQTVITGPAQAASAGDPFLDVEGPARPAPPGGADATQSEPAPTGSEWPDDVPSLDRDQDEPQIYRVFSRDHDEILKAADIATAEDHRAFAGLRSGEHSHHRRLVRRIAHRLLRKLMIAAQPTWLFDREQGRVDPSRLVRLITQVDARRVFREETSSPVPDTVVSLLVDHSGSMQGERLRMAALSVDVIVSVLESCRIKCEVLSYTTRYWAENPLSVQWRSQGASSPPGRLNATRHIVFKEAATPWRRAAHDCGVMLRQDFGRENIDGEALQWACRRLYRRHEPNKVLIVLSDGSPMDEATQVANAGDILVDHLRRVIHEIESQGRVQLAAIGIGHEVSRYYSRAMDLDRDTTIGEALEAELGDMIISPLASAG